MIVINKRFCIYIEYKNIKIDKSIDINKTIELDSIKEHIKNLSSFHKALMGYEFSVGDELPNNLGGHIEQCKTSLKCAERYINMLKEKENLNQVEEFITKEGPLAIKLGKKSIEDIYDKDFLSVIRRAMDRKEVILGYFAPYNLRKDNNTLYVHNIDNCAYDFIEMDYIKMLMKIKKNKKDVLTNELIEYCTEKENLSLNSYEIIKSFTMFPYNFIRNLNRYKERRKPWTLEEYYRRIYESIDGDMS